MITYQQLLHLFSIITVALGCSCSMEKYKFKPCSSRENPELVTVTTSKPEISENCDAVKITYSYRFGQKWQDISNCKVDVTGSAKLMPIAYSNGDICGTLNAASSKNATTFEKYDLPKTCSEIKSTDGTVTKSIIIPRDVQNKAQSMSGPYRLKVTAACNGDNRAKACYDISFTLAC